LSRVQNLLQPTLRTHPHWTLAAGMPGSTTESMAPQMRQAILRFFLWIGQSLPGPPPSARVNSYLEGGYLWRPLEMLQVGEKSPLLLILQLPHNAISTELLLQEIPAGWFVEVASLDSQDGAKNQEKLNHRLASFDHRLQVFIILVVEWGGSRLTLRENGGTGPIVRGLKQRRDQGHMDILFVDRRTRTEEAGLKPKGSPAQTPKFSNFPVFGQPVDLALDADFVKEQQVDRYFHCRYYTCAARPRTPSAHSGKFWQALLEAQARTLPLT